MASPLEAGFSCRDGEACFSFLDDCDGKRSTQVSYVQQGTRQRDDAESAMKETQDLLTSEFNKLSIHERAKAMDDVHCVGGEIQETPEMIEQALKEFDQLVQTTANHIYVIAVNQNRSFVEDRSFRLKFLRANVFIVRKSVTQMMGFLRHKALYFGLEKLTKDVFPEDLGPEDLGPEVVALMRTGMIHTLKDRDRSGRVILYISSFDRMSRDCKLETLCRFYYFVIYNIVLSIPSAQSKGVVMIYNDEAKGGNSHFPGLSVFAKAISFFTTIPIRASSAHLCLHSSPGSLTLHNKMLQLAMGFFSEQTLQRTRLHYGSDMERQYHLRSFGIPLENFPVDTNGNIQTESHEAWCDEYLRHTNQHQASNEITTTPWNRIQANDVLLGRGRIVQNHPGNVRFRRILDSHAEEYDRLSRRDRMPARIRYTQELLSSGTRFWKKSETHLWVVCDFDEAMDKVSTFFRSRRRDKKRGAETGI